MIESAQVVRVIHKASLVPELASWTMRPPQTAKRSATAKFWKADDSRAAKDLMQLRGENLISNDRNGLGERFQVRVQGCEFACGVAMNNFAHKLLVKLFTVPQPWEIIITTSPSFCLPK